MTAITSNDLYRFKILFLLENPGRNILTFILKKGTNAPSGVRLDEYLQHLPQDSKANYAMRAQGKNKKSPFNSVEMHQIERDPLWNNFDISLLYKAITLGCEGLAKTGDVKWKSKDEMEGLIQDIKNERNLMIHEKLQMTEGEFQAKVDKLKNLFVKTLDVTKIRYKVLDAEFTPVRDKVLQDVTKILQMEIEREISKHLWEGMLPEFIAESQKHLKDLYEQAQFFDPLSFLSGSPHGDIHIQSIFCKMFLTEQNQDAKNIREIDSFNMLTVTQSSQVEHSTPCKKPQCIIIKGMAGSGKTTLLTFLLSEWLKDASYNRIKHLDEYDIVLRILCREVYSPSLREFLKHTLPDFFAVMENYLVTLVKKCKVLFLIDGLDELLLKSSTHQLVNDIMNIANEVPGYTIICTSRPEAVQDFLNNVPAGYQHWKMEMKGVCQEQRTDFVLSYYDTLPFKGNKYRERLKYLMESIGWKDHFGLPLNLLFVATLFHKDPDCVKNNTTQAILYLCIHEWCVQKLQARLARHTELKRDRLSREDGIKRVLKVIYNVALQGLLMGRLKLSKDDIQRIRISCTKEMLPSEEVMGAFFCIREAVVRLVLCQKYFTPHKSIQEFYAAKSIVQELEEDSCGVSIRHLLHDPSPKQLNDLKNLLLHTAGLLGQRNTPSHHRAIQEVVNLLAETGRKSCNDWMALLEDSEVSRTVLECVAGHIINDDGDDNDNEIVTVTDSTTNSASALLPLITPREVHIRFSKSDSDVFRACTKHMYTKVHLQHHYKLPNRTASSDSLLQTLSRSHLKKFMGHLSAKGINLLKQCQHLTHLYLSVSNSQDAQTCLRSLATASPSLPRLKNIYLHIPVYAVRPSSLTTRLLDCCSANLILSDVSEALLERTCKIAAALQPGKKRVYQAIAFPGSNLKADMWMYLMDVLSGSGVRVWQDMAVPHNSPISEEQWWELHTYARDRMLSGFTRQLEDELWTLKWL